MDITHTLSGELDSRRRELGIPYSALSELSGVSQSVVQRLLCGKLSSPRFQSVVAVAQALGMRALEFLESGSIKFAPSMSARSRREQQARKKAERLVEMVQGTSALEGQAVDGAAYEAMVERAYHELLAGSDHRLWSL
jgi:transcriptional regulator with XRE-family HTH domain